MRRPSWNVRTNSAGQYRAYYDHQGHKHRLRGGTFQAEFPIPSPALLKSIARSAELTAYLATEVNADRADQWIRAFITRTNPQLDGWPDLPALVEWIRLSVGHFLEHVPPAARLRERPDSLRDPAGRSRRSGAGTVAQRWSAACRVPQHPGRRWPRTVASTTGQRQRTATRPPWSPGADVRGRSHLLVHLLVLSPTPIGPWAISVELGIPP